MSLPWLPAEPLPAAEIAAVRRRAIFDCFKWDPQVEDTAVLANVPLILRPEVWNHIASLAESLAAEALAAEQELCGRSDLMLRLGLSRRLVRMMRRALAHGQPPRAATLVRFDFHLTTEGWRISEANTDVPGGLNEAAGIAALMAARYPGTTTVGDPATVYASALLRACPSRPSVALVHATAYADDHQVMRFLGRELERQGGRPVLVGPTHLRWKDGRVRADGIGPAGPLDAVMRFFPGEWLIDLPASCGADRLFSGGSIPISNPATALLTQSKRFPLVWSELRTALPTWRALLGETRDPRDVPPGESEDWVLKPALGRVGEGICMDGITPRSDRRKLRADAWWRPGRWAAQRRFRPVPFDIGGERWYPCIGIYTVDGRAAGAYGRMSKTPLIDWRARDVAVLTMRSCPARDGENHG